MEDRLLFVIGSPRSGSTLLTRMLGSHSAIYAPAEPHLLTPLAHLGYYASVDRAPYDTINVRDAIRDFVAELPKGESDYLDALRAYTDTLYRRALERSGCERFLDKTPAYALVLDFLAKLYPRAHYLVLTRHPMAIWSSYVDSFFDGDPEVAHAHNPILERYVPAIARFLRERPVPILEVRYESLVARPAEHMEQICGFLDLPFEPGMVNYGDHAHSNRGLGDPVTVAKETRPTTKSVAKWAGAMAESPAKLARARRILESLLDEDLETWGYARAEIERQLADARPSGTRRRRPWNRYALQRRLLVRLRRNIHRNAFGRLVRRVRYVCDVLLN
ncbi:MAG: sulfotransferase [Deltaproteobacteria bacterium]|nr:MAG: sulfotransferase [Deltaproteobacteria bacterium]